jgi:hypothetical protein
MYGFETQITLFRRADLAAQFMTKTRAHGNVEPDFQTENTFFFFFAVTGA